MKPASLPAPFAALAGKVDHVRQVSATEFCGSCPQCGDQGHHGRDLPDRFRMFLDDHPTGWCRRCSYLWYPDMADANTPKPSRAQLDAWRREQIQREEARKRSAEIALAHLRDEQLWEVYYAALDDQARSYWRRRGVPDAFVDYWRLGWARARRFGGVQCDSATIPLFGEAGDVLNIKHRLQDESAGRYRYELIGLEAPPFLCKPGESVGGHVIAVEGEIKSMVTFATLDDASVCMIGLPGTNPAAGIIDTLKRADRVTLVMDPGAKRDGIDLARQIGIAKTWLLVPPVKIDDGILAAGLDSREVRQVLESALELKQYVTG